MVAAEDLRLHGVIAGSPENRQNEVIYKNKATYKTGFQVRNVKRVQ